MSEYWKSLPRKFCDTCKCWFADNKASIEFHEKGKRHQENVQKRITDIQKRGLKEFKAKKKLENEMEKIEKAALEAFKKDLEQNPELAARYKVEVPSVSLSDETNEVRKVKTSSPDVNGVRKSEQICEEAPSDSTKAWYEAVSEEGYTYYWNSESSESQWEPPEDGYISLQEQNESSNNDEAKTSKDHTDDTSEPEMVEKVVLEQTAAETISDTIGPQPKPEPYGKWVTVEHKEEEYVDLQLPAKPDVVEMHIPLTKDTFKIKEKTVGNLADTYDNVESTFKRRKLGNAKRNVRQRFVDES